MVFTLTQFVLMFPLTLKIIPYDELVKSEKKSKENHMKI